jgi:hypothetical protein
MACHHDQRWSSARNLLGSDVQQRNLHLVEGKNFLVMQAQAIVESLLLDFALRSSRRANKRKGHGTYANDRPPIISIISHDTGEQRFWVGATRTGGRAVPSSPKTFQLATRGCIPANGRATGAVIRPMPLSAMVYANGRGMTMVMAHVKFIATPVREQVRRFVPTCVPSGVFTSSTYISMWLRMKPWSMRNASHPI